MSASFQLEPTSIVEIELFLKKNGLQGLGFKQFQKDIAQ